MGKLRFQFRLRVRTLLLAVAILAALMGGGVRYLRARQGRCLRIADVHAAQEIQLTRRVQAMEVFVRRELQRAAESRAEIAYFSALPDREGAADSIADAEFHLAATESFLKSWRALIPKIAATAAWHAQVKGRFRRLAERPWQPIPPDPQTPGPLWRYDHWLTTTGGLGGGYRDRPPEERLEVERRQERRQATQAARAADRVPVPRSVPAAGDAHGPGPGGPDK